MIEKILKLLKEHPIELVSSVVAIISAMLSYISYRISRKALLLAQKEFDSKQTNFNIYLIDSLSWTDSSYDLKRYLLFYVSISNKSQSKSSYQGVLDVHYTKQDSKTGIVSLLHQPLHIDSTPLKNLIIYPTDIRIEEKSSESKWLIFKVPQKIVSTNKINKYNLKIVDVNDKMQSVDVYLIKEFKNEN